MSTQSQIWNTRSLDGWVIGVSVANADDLASHGYTSEDVNRATVRLSEALLHAGARLVFGHDWRPDGVMDAICRIAVKYQPPFPERSAPLPLIQNLLPWPNQPTLDAELRRDLEQRGVLKVQTIGLPDCQWTSPGDPTARAISLTHMRRELVKRTNARICLGGKVQSTEGFFAGIVEEAYNAALAGQPVYVGRFLGGAAARLVNAMQHAPRNEHALRGVDAKKATYEMVLQKSPDLVPPWDLSEAFSTAKLQRLSGLNPEDWESLLNAPDVEVFSTYVIRGLSNLPRPGAEVPASPISLPPPRPAPKSSPPRRRKP